MKRVGGVLYCNDGDWVESCTALVEHDDGRLEIVQWHIVSHEGSVNAPASPAATIAGGELAEESVGDPAPVP